MCPPGTDQTERSRERWYILAPMIEKGIEDISRLGRFYMFELLQTKSFPRSADEGSPASSVAYPSRTARLSPLELLPTELLSFIFAYLDQDARDLMALGLSSTKLWHHFLHSDVGRNDLEAGAFSNTPLFSISNYLHRVPTRVSELFPRFEGWDSWRRPDGRLGTKPARIWLSSVRAETTWILDEEDENEPSWTVTLGSIRDHGLDAATMQQLARDLRQVTQEPDVGEMGTKWLLRNLRTKEYVRLETSSDPDPPTEKLLLTPPAEAASDEAQRTTLVATVASAPWLSLDTGIFFMTRYPKVGGNDVDEVRESAWVGHEFDILSEAQWQSFEHDEWTDATQVMIRSSKGGRQEAFSRFYHRYY